MNRYSIMFLSGHVEQTGLPKGLILDDKDYAKGFVIEAESREIATPILLRIDTKWSTWADRYNQWVAKMKALRRNNKR